MAMNAGPTNDDERVPDECEVLVLGGGPAGTTVAALTAEQGRNVVLLERGTPQRFHVGESLIPDTYWSLERLGLLDWLRNSAFPKKYSVQFVTETGKESAPFYFDEHRKHESAQTWQVWRDEFDQRLMENARDKGAVVCNEAHVRDLLTEDSGAVCGARVQIDGPQGTTTDIRSRVVVDATGISAFIASRFGLKQVDPRLKKATVWSYFEGAHRDAGRDEGATIILQTAGKKSWFWYIPLPDDVVSVGVTGEIADLFTPGSTAEDVFQRELDRCPGMLRRLESATRCREFHTTRDYSYTTSQVAGEGWILVGDAAGFIDPVYSTGVFLAFKSGEFVADALTAAFESGDFSPTSLSAWHGEYCEGVELFRKLVYAFYAPEFSFGTFLREHPQYHENVSDILMGDVFKPHVGEMFEHMGDVVGSP